MNRNFSFADGRPDRSRELEGSGGVVRVAGEFAHLATNAEGLLARR